MTLAMRRFLAWNVVWGVLMLAPAAMRANVFVNPPFSVDELLVLEGEGLKHNAKYHNTRFSPRTGAIELVDGALSGSAYLGPIRTKFAFNEAIPSWNGWAPGGGGWRVWMRVGRAGDWSPWFEAGSWGEIDDSVTTRVATFKFGKYDIDCLMLDEPMDRVEMRIDFVRGSGSTASPRVRLVALSYSNTLCDRALWRQFARYREAASPALQSRRTTFTLAVKFRSQVVANKQWIGRICAPASLAMAATGFGIDLPTEQFAAEVYDPVSDLFGVWHRMVQGGAQHGLRGYVTRFRSWEDVRRAVERGYVICASVRFRHGEIPNPPRIYQRRGTEGHLFVIVGLGAQGTLLVHDSASKDWGRYNVWTTEQLQRAWFDKGGVGIVFTGRTE